MTAHTSRMIGCIVMVLGFAACSNNVDGSSENEDVAAFVDESTVTTPPEGDPETTLAPGTVQTTGSKSVSPLNSAFVTMTELDVDEWDELVVQEYLAACMREQGFEYWPHVEESEVAVSDWDRPIFPVGNPSDTTSTDPVVDLNLEYRSSLTEPELRAYWEALTGDDPDVTVVEGSHEGDSDVDATGGSGCDGQARRRYEAELQSAASETSEANESLFAQLDEAVNQLFGELEADENVIAAVSEYSGCLADAGFPAQYPSGAYDTVYWMPSELVWYLRDQGADLFDALASDPEADPVDLIGLERAEELAQLERTARQAHADCVQPLEEAVRTFEIEYARSDSILDQYLSEG